MAAQFGEEHFRNLYNDELIQADKLDAAMNLPAAVLTALSGVALYYSRIAPPLSMSFATIVFYFLGTIFAVLFLVSTFCLIMAMQPRNRTFVGTPLEQQEFLNGLVAYYAAVEKVRDPQLLAESDFRNGLRGKYVEAAEANRQLNVTKMAWHARARRFMSFAIFCVFLNALPTLFVQRLQNDAQKVRIQEMPPLRLEESKKG